MRIQGAQGAMAWGEGRRDGFLTQIRGDCSTLNPLFPVIFRAAISRPAACHYTLVSWYFYGFCQTENINSEINFLHPGFEDRHDNQPRQAGNAAPHLQMRDRGMCVRRRQSQRSRGLRKRITAHHQAQQSAFHRGQEHRKSRMGFRQT